MIRVFPRKARLFMDSVNNNEIDFKLAEAIQKYRELRINHDEYYRTNRI